MEFGDNQYDKEGTQNCAPKLSAKNAAKIMGVSERSVVNAKKVMKEKPEAHALAG